MIMDKKGEVVLFSSTAIALYGYDQGIRLLSYVGKRYVLSNGR